MLADRCDRRTLLIASAGVRYTRLRVRSSGGAGRDGNACQWRAGVSAFGRHRKALVLKRFLALNSGAVSGAQPLARLAVDAPSAAGPPAKAFR